MEVELSKLLNKMEEKLRVIIQEEGYSEMADGFEQAIDVVKDYFGLIISF